jgi:hypothetical protein
MLKLRYKAMSNTKGSSSNNAGDGPVFCGACKNEHLTKDYPSYIVVETPIIVIASVLSLT